jgi:hypothetical protein
LRIIIIFQTSSFVSHSSPLGSSRFFGEPVLWIAVTTFCQQEAFQSSAESQRDISDCSRIVFLHVYLRINNSDFSVLLFQIGL